MVVFTALRIMVVTILTFTEDIIVRFMADIRTMEEIGILHTIKGLDMLILQEVAEHIQTTMQEPEEQQIITEADNHIPTDELMLQEDHVLQAIIITDHQIVQIRVLDLLLTEVVIPDIHLQPVAGLLQTEVEAILPLEAVILDPEVRDTPEVIHLVAVGSPDQEVVAGLEVAVAEDAVVADINNLSNDLQISNSY